MYSPWSMVDSRWLVSSSLTNSLCGLCVIHFCGLCVKLHLKSCSHSCQCISRKAAKRMRRGRRNYLTYFSVRSTTKLPLLPSQRIAQICLFLFAAIAIFGGILQMYLGEPDTTPRLDNIHRFLAGVYLACGFICFWAAVDNPTTKHTCLPHCVSGNFRRDRTVDLHEQGRTT